MTSTRSTRTRLPQSPTARPGARPAPHAGRTRLPFEGTAQP